MTIGTEKMPVLVLDRVIGAPIDLVWKAWADPDHFIRWWGPLNNVSPALTIEPRESGNFVICTRSRQDNGCDVSYSCAVCKKIAPLERIQLTQHRLNDDEGFLEPLPIAIRGRRAKEVRLEIIFKARGKWTELSILEFCDAAGPIVTYSQEELHQSIDKLVESLDHESHWPIGRMSLRVLYLFWGGFILLSSVLFWFIFLML